MRHAGGARLDLGGTIRARAPARTLRTLQPLLRRFGITRVARVTGLDTLGLPTSVSVRPASRHLTTSQGKGITPELADISAIMESIEGWHAEHVRPAERTASHRRLARRDAAMDPRDFPAGVRHARISPDREMGWLGAHDLRTGEPVWIPHAVTAILSTRDHPDDGLFRVSSNGLAAGNTRAEALCHALYEVVERESEWRWACLPDRRRESTRVDPDTVRVPFLRALIDRADCEDLEFAVWDVTCGLGIPVYRAVLADRDPSRGLGWFQGAGAHRSPRIALSRALTEAAQSRLTWIVGTREDLLPDHYLEEEARPWRLPPKGPFGRSFADRGSAGRTLEEDLDWILSRLLEAGHPRVVAFDHTRPELGIPVLHVFVPGFQLGEH